MYTKKHVGFIPASGKRNYPIEIQVAYPEQDKGKKQEVYQKIIKLFYGV